MRPIHRHKEAAWNIAFVVCSIVLATKPCRLLGLEIAVGTGKPTTARALVVMRGTVSSVSQVVGVGLSISQDGVNFEHPNLGSALREDVCWVATSDQRETTILIPVVWRFDNGIAKFLFQDPGTYYVKLRATLEGGEAKSLDGLVRVVVGRSRSVDDLFLTRLGDRAVLQRFFGNDPFENTDDDFRKWVRSPAGADHRALTVVRELLQATRSLVPDDVFGPGKRSQEDAPHWAETLWALVEETPDSSYAPYAAFYSGLCDAGLALGQAVDGVRAARVPGERKDKFAEYRRRVELLQQDERFGKALRALKFATERSDDYLRPIALSQLGFLTVCGGNVDEGKKLLQESVEILGVGGSRVEHIQKQLLEIEEIQKGIGGQSAQEPNK